MVSSIWPSTGAARRGGTPTAPTMPSRSRRPSSTPSPCRAAAATPSSRACTRRTTRCLRRCARASRGDGAPSPTAAAARLPPSSTRTTETGRKGLYFDPGKILRIEGLEKPESDDLIEELTERMIQPEGEYRHRWRRGDVVIWDNRCSYHKAAGDYPPEEDRIHWRVSIKERASPSATS